MLHSKLNYAYFFNAKKAKRVIHQKFIFFLHSYSASARRAQLSLLSTDFLKGSWHFFDSFFFLAYLQLNQWKVFFFIFLLWSTTPNRVRLICGNTSSCGWCTRTYSIYIVAAIISTGSNYITDGDDVSLISAGHVKLRGLSGYVCNWNWNRDRLRHYRSLSHSRPVSVSFARFYWPKSNQINAHVLHSEQRMLCLCVCACVCVSAWKNNCNKNLVCSLLLFVCCQRHFRWQQFPRVFVQWNHVHILSNTHTMREKERERERQRERG